MREEKRGPRFHYIAIFFSSSLTPYTQKHKQKPLIVSPDGTTMTKWINHPVTKTSFLVIWHHLGNTMLEMCSCSNPHQHHPWGLKDPRTRKEVVNTTVSKWNYHLNSYTINLRVKGWKCASLFLLHNSSTDYFHNNSKEMSLKVLGLSLQTRAR